tara:strand:+ start:1115 stop:2182 length:1068 start_codon:yes stop_codon:yes gene_type:complete
MSNRAKFRNRDRRLQQERAAANRAANPEKYARDPNKRQMGRAAAKARMEAEAEAEAENKNKPANPEVTNDFKRQAKQGAAEELPANLRYPYSTIDNTQDFIKFSVFKYKRNEGGGSRVARSDSDLKSKLLGTIILPIPANLVDSNSTNYGQGNMNFMQEAGLDFAENLTTGKGAEAGKNINSMIESASGGLVKNYFATQAINSIGGNLSIDQVMARNSGQIINPNMELLFSGPTLRNFSYQFKFTPRFQKEAETVRTIIKAFKRNMAPKGAGGDFLKTPNVFEIQYVGKAEDYLNRIKLCALKNVAMNYTGDGTWATYNDGSPISMTMTLAFTELTPVFNEDYAAYGDNSDGVGY